MTFEIRFPHDTQLEAALQAALKLLLSSLSHTSQRQYRHTFKQWAQWCAHNDVPVADLRASNLIDFLHSTPLAHATKKNRLSHLRKLLEALHSADPANIQLEAMYKQAKLMKIKRDPTGEPEPRRDKHALSRKQVYAAFAVWQKSSNQHKRNRAILTVLFYAGLRRSECAALQWRDIDLNGRLLTVRHGKGDKQRTVPIHGAADVLQYLIDWQAVAGQRTWVFCAVDQRDRLKRADQPLSDKSIYNVVRTTGDAIGLPIAAHDARRTLISGLLRAGTSLADAQFQAGHADGATTMQYAIVKDAQAVAARAKLDY